MKREDVIKLLGGSNFDEPKFQNEVLSVLNSSTTIMYRLDKNMDTKRQYKTLSRRIKTSNLVGLSGLNELLLKLSDESNESFELLTLSTNRMSYLLYLSYDLKRLIGIIRDDNLKTKDYLDLQEQYLERRFDVNVMRELI